MANPVNVFQELFTLRDQPFSAIPCDHFRQQIERPGKIPVLSHKRQKYEGGKQAILKGVQ